MVAGDAGRCEKAWAVQKDWVDYAFDAGTQAFGWDDCQVACVRVDRAVVHWSHGVDSLLYLVQDLRMTNLLGEDYDEGRCLQGIHGLRMIQFHTPFTGQVWGLDRTNPRIPYTGNAAQLDDDETSTMINEKMQEWDRSGKLRNFPALVELVKRRYALLGKELPSSISVEELLKEGRPKVVGMRERSLSRRTHSE